MGLVVVGLVVVGLVVEGSLFVRPEAVVLRLTGHAEQHEQPDGTDDRYEENPIPLTTLAYVVEATPGYAQTGQNQCQKNKIIESARKNDGAGIPLHVSPCLKTTQCKTNDSGSKRIPPILCAFCTTVEVAVILKYYLLKG